MAKLEKAKEANAKLSRIIENPKEHTQELIKKETRGGVRLGAGRKPKSHAHKSVQIRVPLEEVENVKKNSKRIFKEILKVNVMRDDLILKIVKTEVERYFNLSGEEILIPIRNRRILIPRQIAMFFSRQLTKYTSLSEIGRIYNKNHATVLHSCSIISDLIITNKEIRTYCSELEPIIKSKLDVFNVEILYKAASKNMEVSMFHEC